MDMITTGQTALGRELVHQLAEEVRRCLREEYAAGKTSSSVNSIFQTLRHGLGETKRILDDNYSHVNINLASAALLTLILIYLHFSTLHILRTCSYISIFLHLFKFSSQTQATRAAEVPGAVEGEWGNWS